MHHQCAAQRGQVAGKRLAWGSQDSTVDPKGSLETVPQIDGASRFLSCERRHTRAAHEQR
jgi:hypothetical protein